MDKKTIRDIEVAGKTVLVRVDFNVPRSKETGEITNDNRIVAALPTIKYLLEQSPKAIVLFSHLGKVKTEEDKAKNNLAVVAPRLAELLGRDVKFVDCTRGAELEEAVKNAMKKIKGAYSLIVMSPRKLIGARDPFGFKPLCIGKRDNTYFLSSETCALDTVGAEFIRDVLPGEIVTITKDGIQSDTSLCQKNTARCIFEYIYFARPDSRIDGMGVYESRVNAGRILAKTHPVEADLVVGVPESGNPAALGYSMESGIPYGNAFIKNNYVGRTFIKPKQEQRESSVKVKLNVLKEEVAGKRVVMIDDSIVRGTTSRRIVNLLRQAGAKEVHVRISSPAFLHPCYFGTDIPSEDQLVASGRTVDEICKYIEADSLGYLETDKLSEMICNQTGFCDACFTGNYPIEPPEIDIRGEMG